MLSLVASVRCEFECRSFFLLAFFFCIAGFLHALANKPISGKDFAEFCSTIFFQETQYRYKH